MKIIYTDEPRAVLAQFVPGHTSDEIAQEFNSRYPATQVTAKKIRSLKKRFGLKSGTPRGFPKGTHGIFPAEVVEFLRANNRGKTAQEITALLNATFGSAYTREQIKRLRARLKLRSGLSGRFEKNHVPANKGKKGTCPAGCEKGWFRKGHVPHNHHPVGTEILSTDGYLKIKVAEPRTWKFKHLIEWEKHKGPVPAGFMVAFKDGDHLNCDISNLMLLSRAENGMMNRAKLRSKDAAITETGKSLATLMCRVKHIEKKFMKEVVEYKRV